MTAITPATPDDAAEISRVAEAAFTATFSFYPPEDLSAFLAEWNPVEKVARQLAEPEWHFQVARDDDGIAGFIKLGPVDFDLPDIECDDAAAIELHQLYMLERAKGSGAAQQLMDWALTTARAMGMERMYLSVFIENKRAQAFYRRNGFYEVGRNAFRVGNTVDDDRIWRLDL